MKPFRLTALPTPAVVSTRRRAGLKAQRVGSNFQKVVHWSAGIHKDIVSLESLPAFGAMRVGGGKTVFLPICCDYVGALINQRGLFFDAKSCGEDAISFNVKTLVLSKPHQLDFLRRMGKAGQVSGYMVECCSLQKYLWIDVCHIVDDGPIRFARDGVLCRQWRDLGSFQLAVDFKKLRAAYAEAGSP